jgi:Gas vesicle synthesis protein GvpL/GvpF
MLWVYGICDRPELRPPPRRGLAQAPLDGLREGSLLAVFSRHVQAIGEPAPDALWAHERVVERLMVDRHVLPMRFGTRVGGEAELRRFLSERQVGLLATIARVAGRVELAVRVLEASPNGHDAAAVVAPSSGRDYLLAKLRGGQRAQRLTTWLHEPLAGLATEARLQPARGADEVLHGAYLVETPVLPRFRATVERLQERHPDLAMLCTGPWPPYSFVDAISAQAAAPEPSAL